MPFALTGGTPAAAADACPNAALRVGASAHLPECRAYELVSPVQKFGNPVTAPLTASADGRIAFSAVGAFADAQSSIMANYSSRRTDAGWQTSALNPPTPYRLPQMQSQFYPLAFSGDLSRALVQTTFGVAEQDRASGPQGHLGNVDIYRIDAGGKTDWISTGTLPPAATAIDVVYGGASEDAEQVAFQTRRRLVPEVPDDTTQHVYVGDGDTTALVSVGPDGRPLPGGGAIVDAPTFFASITVNGTARRSVSADGAKVVFTSPAAGGPLYLRTDPLGPAAQTREISRSADGVTQCAAPRLFTMTRDGRRVLFSCTEQLTGDAPVGGGLYAYDTVDATLELMAGGLDGALIAADADADHLYFRSQVVLLPEALPGGNNLYAWHDGELKLIGTSQSVQEPFDPPALTPDGSRIAFGASGDLDPELDENGFDQVFLFDFATGETVCVSCPQDGSPASARAGFKRMGGPVYAQAGMQPTPGAVSADGRRVFFTSGSDLVPDDVNRVDDAYVLLDGRHHLISTGTEAYPAIFAGASADGTDAFLMSQASLAPQDVDQGITDVYSARIGGGFPAPPAKPICDGDCQGPPTAPPAPPALGSQLVTGEGNAEAEDEPARAPAARVTVAGRRSVRGPVASLAIRVSGAGTLTVSGASVRRSSRTVAKAGTQRVTVRLSARARRRLATRGRVHATVKISYRAKQGGSAARTVKLTFRGSKGGR